MRGELEEVEKHIEEFKDVTDLEDFHIGREEGVSEVAETIRAILGEEAGVCVRNRGTSGKGNDWEEGFLDGLSRAYDVIGEVAKLVKAD